MSTKKSLLSSTTNNKNLLTSVMSNSIQFNTTVDANATLNPLTPGHIDWDLQCDFANSEYLRALIAQDIIQVAIKTYETMIDGQLLQQFELLETSRQKHNDLKNKLEEYEAMSEIRNQLAELECVYKEFEGIIQLYKVPENLHKYIEALQLASNKLRLKNIKKFTKQEEYDKFQGLLHSCIDSIENFKIIIGDIKNMQILGENVGKFVELKSNYVKKRKLLNDLHISVGLSLFKNISDRFAQIAGYDEE